MQHLISIIAVISWLKMILIYIFPLVLWVAWEIPQLVYLDFLLINHLLAHQLRLKVPDDLSPLSSRSLKGNSA